MTRVRLILWNAAEAEERAAKLRSAGYDVASGVPGGPTFLRELRQDPPGAVVIDLTRLPSQGRDVALALRISPKTRSIPIVFTEGDPKKVERIQQILPDAVYTSWRRVLGSLKRAIAHPPANPFVPRSGLEGYSGVALAKKLGIKANAVVALVGAPEDFDQTLGELPEGVVLRRQARGRCDLILWFARSRQELERRVQPMGARAGKGGLWILWPKKASGVTTDLSQTVVRKVGLAAGLVDYKISAIDATWAGLRFTRRAAG